MNLDELFQSEQDKYKRIKEAGGWQRYYDSLENKKQLTKSASSGRVLCCTDERVRFDDPCVCVEGSLLLSEWGDAQRFCQEAGIISIYSHADCTAAGILWRRMSGSIPATGTQIEDLCKVETKKLAERLGVTYEGHIGPDGMLGGESEDHPASAIYYVGLEDFNPRPAFADLPIGAVVTRTFREPINALADLGLAMSIAFGPSGYAERLTAENPLRVVVVGGRWDDSGVMLSHEIGRLVARQEGRVVIESLLI